MLLPATMYIWKTRIHRSRVCLQTPHIHPPPNFYDCMSQRFISGFYYMDPSSGELYCILPVFSFCSPSKRSGAVLKNALCHGGRDGSECWWSPSLSRASSKHSAVPWIHSHQANMPHSQTRILWDRTVSSSYKEQRVNTGQQQYNCPQ